MEYTLTVKNGQKLITVTTNFDFGVNNIIDMLESDGKYEVVVPKKEPVKAASRKKGKQGRNWTPEARRRQSEIMKKRWAK